MAAFTSGTVESKMRLGRKDDMDDTHAPLMAAQTRPRTKKSWYRQPRVHVAVGVGVLAVGGFYLLFAAHGGDREARGTKHFVPWGRAAPERIRNHFGELARARARLERAVRSPISTLPVSTGPRGESNLAHAALLISGEAGPPIRLPSCKHLCTTSIKLHTDYALICPFALTPHPAPPERTSTHGCGPLHTE